MTLRPFSLRLNGSPQWRCTVATRTLLAPYSTGPAQRAYRNLVSQTVLNFIKVKDTILDQAGVNPETFLQRLCHAHYPPGKHASAQVEECIALEQFVQVLPTGGSEWVQRHRPWTLGDAVSLMEDYLTAENSAPCLPCTPSYSMYALRTCWHRPGRASRV
uniref:SCAN box domain-containing protein n=1 Tax=Pelusios castaneus TaxID=367368 RepID=A0A8C8S8Z0_9SAUR